MTELASPEVWSAVANVIMAAANIVLFFIAFRTLRNDRWRIMQMEQEVRQRVADGMYAWIEERNANSVSVICRNGANSVVYSVSIQAIGDNGRSIGQRYEIELMKPQEERILRIEATESLDVRGVLVTFRDPSGISWARSIDGYLTEIQDEGRLALPLPRRELPGRNRDV